MESWKKVADAADIRGGVPLLRRVGRMEFLVVRRGDSVHVLGNRCPHAGCRLSEGLLRGAQISCPCHGARFDVTSGEALSPPALDDLPRFAVKVEDGAVFVGPPVSRDQNRSTKGPRVLPGGAATGGPHAATRAPDGTVVIVGGGAAGNACAETLRREGFGGRIRMLTEEADLPCYRPSLSKGLLAGETPEQSLSLRSSGFYDAIGIEVLTRHRVVGLDPASRAVRCASGASFSYGSLLVATGAAPRRLEVPGMELSGVFLLRSRSEGIALAEAAWKASRAVVLGAGFIGMEAASALRTRGLDVLVVAPERLPLQGVFGERIARRLLQLHQANGVRFALGVSATEVKGAAGRVRGVSLSDGTVREGDLVIVGAGGVPATDFLRGSAPLQAGALPVDSRMATAVPGVFAAGDAALVPYGPGSRLEGVGHWVDAERQGQAAARAILGIEGAEFRDERFFWTEQHGSSFTAVGQTGRDPASFRGDPEGGEFLAGYFRGPSLVGAAALGYGREIAWLALALSEGRGVSPEALADPGVDLPSLR